MKSSKVISILLLLLVIFLGCSDSQTQNGILSDSQTQNEISITGEVVKERYMTMGGSASPIAYLVKVTIKNGKETPINFDEIEANFSPSQGNSLKIIKRKYDEKGNIGETLILAPGSIGEYEFSTNGYTYDLLDDAGNEPLKFYIAFNLNNEVVLGPYYTSLPDIETLPYKTSIGDDVKGHTLTFSPI